MFFETFEGKDGQFYFNLRSEDGKVILRSEGYTTTASRDNGIESVKTNGIDETRYEADDNHFNIKAGNGQVIATSMTHDSEDSLAAAIGAVMRGVEAASIKERD